MPLLSRAGATYAKFQKRCPRELLTEEQYNKAHPVPANAYGPTYGAHREFLEFNVAQHKELWEYGKSIGIEWATSTWDVTSAREMIQIPCDYIKVPSACNNHFDMMKVLRDEFKGIVHVSTGMTTKKEIEVRRRTAPLLQQQELHAPPRRRRTWSSSSRRRTRPRLAWSSTTAPRCAPRHAARGGRRRRTQPATRPGLLPMMGSRVRASRLAGLPRPLQGLLPARDQPPARRVRRHIRTDPVGSSARALAPAAAPPPPHHA